MEKQSFNWRYWLDELIVAGKKITPEKYTEEYVVQLKWWWMDQPLTKLVAVVMMRREKASQLTQSK
jgi:hypothetical protein